MAIFRGERPPAVSPTPPTLSLTLATPWCCLPVPSPFRPHHLHYLLFLCPGAAIQLHKSMEARPQGPHGDSMWFTKQEPAGTGVLHPGKLSRAAARTRMSLTRGDPGVRSLQAGLGWGGHAAEGPTLAARSPGGLEGPASRDQGTRSCQSVQSGLLPLGPEPRCWWPGPSPGS